MSYIGTPPSNAFTSLLKQDFSTSATTGYTLDHAVNNANDIALFINFVRQEPTAGYAASGTTLTLTSATASSDDMYCVYLGQALQTVNPANVSVGTAQLIDGAVTSAKLASGVVGDNTPAFAAFQSSGQNIDTGTSTIVTLDTEIFDTDSAFASNAFTVPTGEGGKYYISASVRADASWGATSQFNVSVFIGAAGDNGLFVSNSITASTGNSAAVSGVMALNAGDVITMRIYHNEGGTEGLQAGRYCTVFSGYKLIGV